MKQAAKEKAAIIDDAKRTAKDLIAGTKADMAEEHKKLESDIKNEIKTLSVKVASKVIEREIDEKDNEKLILSSLEEWSKNE